MRSRTGCLTCRSRKLKCDEKKPVCTQCRRGSRECRPSEGIVFRHQQNASMNKGDSGDADPGGGGLTRFFSYKNTFDEDSVWLDIPKQVIFVDNSDPHVEELEASLASPDAAAVLNRQTWSQDVSYQNAPVDTQSHGLEALSAAATRDSYTLQLQQAGPISINPAVGRRDSPYNNQPNVPQSIAPISSPHQTENSVPPPASPSASISSSNNNISFLLNPSTSMSPPIDPILHSPPDRREESLALPRTYAPQSKIEANVETSHEVAFLLRHFSEQPGQWMDLFDLGTYFASYVPVKAVTNPLLKYAACAYAAKHLGRVKGAKATVGGVCSKQAGMELWPDAEHVDWYYYAAKYYEKAIHLLMDALKHDSQGPPLSNPEAFGQWQAAELVDDADYPHKRRRRFPNSRLSSAHSDEVLAAAAILSVYEFLDATGPAWNRHLSGVKSLLDIAEVGMLPLEQHISHEGTPLPPPKKHGFSKARRATFWNFARQDYLSAFINECQSRLNTEDLDLWTEAGLLLDNVGFVKPSNTTGSGYPEGDDVMSEDLISNALIWILTRIVNYMAVGDDINVNDNLQPGASRIGVSQHALLERWSHLESSLDAWYNGLPDTFKACARIEPPRDNFGQEDTYPFPEVWYSIPMCASTMQHYHMARILLLINKPHESTARRSTLPNRLKSYRSIDNEIRFHSHEICGISMSRPEASVRIHSVQPLFVSGQSLTDPRERRSILNLLRGIEHDIGWATEYRVKQLLREWGWDEGAPAVSVT